MRITSTINDGRIASGLKPTFNAAHDSCVGRTRSDIECAAEIEMDDARPVRPIVVREVDRAKRWLVGQQACEGADDDGAGFGSSELDAIYGIGGDEAEAGSEDLVNTAGAGDMSMGTEPRASL